jgi:asparagine synthase (glutamine-hydrolysing)
MCGILVVINSDYKKENLDKSLSLMSHRGPDYSNSLEIDGHYFGHVRLSILDLNKRSNQPFKKGNIIITFNGEVYNYLELIKEHSLNVKTTSDTEVIIEMYKKYKHKCLDYLNGMFAFIIYSKNSGSLFIARDRLGIKPLYYRKIGKSLILSSEVAPILGIKKDDFDSFGIRQYRKLRMTIGDYTVYKNIKQFPAAHYSDGKYQNRYWDFIIDDKKAPDDEELFNLINHATKIRTRSDVPVGSYLSGGLDSTILTYLMQPTHTWTVGFKNENEFEWSTIANSLHSSVLHKVLIEYDEFIELGKKLINKRKEPLSVPNEILIYKMTKEVKKENTVVLSGEGADELFWGYDRIFKWANKLNDKIDIKQFDQYYCYGSHADDEVIDFALEGLPGEKPIDKIAYYFQVVHLQGLLRRLDNSTMNCSVEARVPFVDHRLVEMMSGVPFEWRMGNSFKEPLKRIFKNLIPDRIINREKVGFPVPLKKIFRSKNEKNGMDMWLDFNIKYLSQS